MASRADLTPAVRRTIRELWQGRLAIFRVEVDVNVFRFHRRPLDRDSGAPAGRPCVMPRNFAARLEAQGWIEWKPACQSLLVYQAHLTNKARLYLRG